MDISLLDSAAERAAARAKRIEEESAKYREKHRDLDLAIQAERKRLDEQRAIAEPMHKDDRDVEPGEIDSEAELEVLPVRSKSQESSQQASGSQDILASFKPRKEPRVKDLTEESESKRPSYQVGNERKKKSNLLALNTKTNDAASSTSLIIANTPNGSSSESATASRPTSTIENAPRTASPSNRSTAAFAAGTKRPAHSKISTLEQKSNLSSLPKIQKRTSVASPQSPERAEPQPSSAVGNTGPPEWYKLEPAPKKRSNNPNDGNVDILLQGLRTQTDKTDRPGFARDANWQQKVFADISDKLQKAPFLKVNRSLLKGNLILGPNGLPRLFDGSKYPFYIAADARELYNKWCRQDFETDLLRGIHFEVPKADNKKDRGRNTDSLDKSYKRLEADHYGNNDLENGQWWATQLCTLRDGAHGHTQGGIYGDPGKGAYSCIISGGHDYPDQDNGEEVLYCGTDSDDGSVTSYTQRMLETVNSHAVRLIRSSNLKSEYSPSMGFRYDGLYDVVSFEKIDPAHSLRQRHRFRLVRQPGQDPIRGGEGPQSRPNPQEIKAYQEHKRLMGRQKD